MKGPNYRKPAGINGSLLLNHYEVDQIFAKNPDKITHDLLLDEIKSGTMRPRDDPEWSLKDS